MENFGAQKRSKTKSPLRLFFNGTHDVDIKETNMILFLKKVYPDKKMIIKKFEKVFFEFAMI